MKLKFRFTHYVFFIFLIIFDLTTLVKAQRLQSHVLELQNRIEAQIDRNLFNLISTQLPPTTFDISTRVKVVEIPPVPPKPKPKAEVESMPAGLDIGVVDVREVIESYKQEIEELKAFKETFQEPKPEPKFAISRIEVVVGLADSYDEAYVAQFNEWLSKRVKLDYGQGAIATVNKVKSLPVKEPGVPAKPTWRDFLPIIAYAFLALALVIAAWLLSRGLIRLGEGVKTIVVENKNALNIEHNQKIEQKLEQKNDPYVSGSQLPSMILDSSTKDEDSVLLQAGEELVGKITYLCLELGRGVNDLVRFWLDNGREGYLKTAVLIDMIITLKEKVSAETEVANNSHKQKYSPETTSAIAAFEIPLDSDLASVYGVHLSEAYREAANMKAELKLEFLEKIYWDLLQIRTLGTQNMRKPFDYLQSMNDMAFAEALKAQPDDTKALALLFGDSQKTKVFFSGMHPDEKERIISKVMGLSQVSKKQLWDMDSAMKLKLINNSMNPEENLLNLFPRTIDMLNTLAPIDEIRVLRKTMSQLPDNGMIVKQQFTSLAFIDEWHVEYVARLVKIATSNELVQLIRVIPECKDIVLSVCPDKMKMIISDDLKISSDNETVITSGIVQLKQKWINICQSENIAMGRVVNSDLRPKWVRNAG